MFAQISNLFGYLLNWLYMSVGQNYGIAIILFSIILRIILLPITVKQQQSMKKNAKLQEEMGVLKVKYKNNPERLNQETMALYKREKMSPFTGCFSAIIQIVLILSVFWLVSQPLTYMKRIDSSLIEQYKQEIKQEYGSNSNYAEIEIIQKKSAQDDRIFINMDFLSLDLSKVPNQNLTDVTVYIIPVLYVISSIISIKLTTSLQDKKKKDIIINKDSKSGEKGKELINTDNSKGSEEEVMQQMNKSMKYFMPVFTVWIAFIAPLGLALYWFISNALMILERLIIKKYIEVKEEKENA